MFRYSPPCTGCDHSSCASVAKCLSAAERTHYYKAHDLCCGLQAFTKLDVLGAALSLYFPPRPSQQEADFYITSSR